MEYKVVTNLLSFPIHDWSDSQKKSDNYNIFQSREIVDFYKKTRNWEPLFIGIVDEKRNWKGYLVSVLQKEGIGLKRYLSSRVIIFAGPVFSKLLSNDEKQIVMKKILQGLIKYVNNKSIYIQFRNLFSLEQFKSSFEKHGFEYHEHLNFRVDTTDKEETWRRISKSKKRQIKQSLKQGAKIIEPENIDQVKEYYLILKNLYKTKVKKPLASWEFFKSFFEFSTKSEIGKYLFVRYDKKIIGGIMCPITPGKVIYEWYICGLDGKYKGIYPSVLATWAAIDYACKNGFDYFDFMGAGSPDKDYGVREFKSKFGGELVNFGRFERINNKFLYFLGKAGLNILKKIK